MAENAFNAVERISEFCDLPQEAPEVIPDTKPDGWPDKGEVCPFHLNIPVLQAMKHVHWPWRINCFRHAHV